MPEQVGKQSRGICAGLLFLSLLVLSISSCRRQPQVPVVPVTPVTPPPPSYLEIGDRSYEAADYPAAIRAYSRYLRENPDTDAADHTLFRLALAYALPSNPSRDEALAVLYLGQLMSRFPESPLRPEAELLVSLQQQLRRVHDEVAQRDLLNFGLRRRFDQLSQEQASGAEEFKGELTRRENRIRQLSEELERLKAIDMQRRPVTPPQ
jgi:hypothetical protein